MRHPKHKPDPSHLEEEIRARQENIVWPGPLVNSRGVDEFLWKGSPNPTVIQRIAAWIFGLTFIGMAFALLALAWNLGGTAIVIFGGGALFSLALGVRHCWSGTVK